MDLRVFRWIDLLLRPTRHGRRAMSSVRRGAKAAAQRDVGAKPANHNRPTVTSNGQVIWSTRDLLFPSGHPARPAPQKPKK